MMTKYSKRRVAGLRYSLLIMLLAVVSLSPQAQGLPPNVKATWTESSTIHLGHDIGEVSLSENTDATLNLVWVEEMEGVRELRLVLLDDTGMMSGNPMNVTDHSWMVPLELEYQRSETLYQLPIRPYFPTAHVGKDGSLYVVYKNVVEYRPYLDPDIQTGDFIKLLKLDREKNVIADKILYHQPSGNWDSPRVRLDVEGNFHIAWREDRNYQMEGEDVELKEIVYMKTDSEGNVLVEPTVVSNSNELSNFTFRYGVEFHRFGMFVDSLSHVHLSWRVDETKYWFGEGGDLRVTPTGNTTTYHTQFDASTGTTVYLVDPTDMGPDASSRVVVSDSTGRIYLIGSALDVFDANLNSISSSTLPISPDRGQTVAHVAKTDRVHIVDGYLGTYVTVDWTASIDVKNDIPVGYGSPEVSIDGTWETTSFDMIAPNDMPIAVASERKGYGSSTEYRMLFTRIVHQYEEPIDPALVVGLPLGILSLASALFISLTEVGRYGFLSLLVPLSLKFPRSETLDHFVRGQIYQYIRANPGDHYSSIRRELNLSNGVLAYHLYVLEKQNFVKSQRDGKLKRFYPVDMMIPQKKGVRLSDLQVKILKKVKKNPTITQGELAGLLGVARQTVSYNIKLMERAGILRSKKQGSTMKYEISSL
ncbi:MAG: winged helix-turn-helix transcriptional regulator [Thermoplasmata archaeon]